MTTGAQDSTKWLAGVLALGSVAACADMRRVADDPLAQDEAAHDDGAPGSELPDCTKLQSAAIEVFRTRCVSCHGDGHQDGEFGEALELDLMVARGFVVPGDPEASEVYDLPARGLMPPGARLDAEQLAAVGAWITCLGDFGEP